MTQMGALYQEKLLEVQQQIVLLQQLAMNFKSPFSLPISVNLASYELINLIVLSCTRHGHEPTRIPILIAGVQESLQHSHD